MRGKAQNNSIRLAALLVCLISIAIGCGKKDPVALVQGKVTYKNKPLDKGSVVFFPEAGTVGAGKLLPDGSFKLLDPLKQEGIPPGSYTAVVIAGEDQIALNPDDPMKRVEPTIPLIFTSKVSSPLKYEIQVGLNEVNISLDEPTSATAK